MKTKTSGLSISTYFGICLGLTFVAASILIVAVVNRSMHNEALSDARERYRKISELSSDYNFRLDVIDERWRFNKESIDKWVLNKEKVNSKRTRR
jgi:hypothetical protein